MNSSQKEESIKISFLPFPSNDKATTCIFDTKQNTSLVEIWEQIFLLVCLDFSWFCNFVWEIEDEYLCLLMQNAFLSSRNQWDTAKILTLLFGLPGLSVLSFTLSSKGRICSLSLPLAAVVRLAISIPFPSVKVWIKIPLPFRPYATSSPALARGKSAPPASQRSPQRIGRSKKEPSIAP